MYPWGDAPAATAPTAAYAVGKPCRNGHNSERDKRGYCIECRRNSIGKHKKRNRVKINTAERARYALDPALGKERDRRRYEKDFIKIALKSAKKRADKKKLPYNLAENDVQVPTLCPVFSIELKIGKGKFNNASPSLDRIVPALGYVRGNVWVISQRANRIKNDASVEELQTLIEAIKKQLACFLGTNQSTKLATLSIPATVAETSSPWTQSKLPWE